jgi:hypothetical protein
MIRYTAQHITSYSIIYMIIYYSTIYVMTIFLNYKLISRYGISICIYLAFGHSEIIYNIIIYYFENKFI